MNVFDQPKIDTHCHILDPQRFPYPHEVAYKPAGQEMGTLDQYQQVMQAYGITQALLVGPNSGYNTDNRCLLDAIRQGDGRFKGIAVVPLNIGREALLELRSQGVIGLAFNSTMLGCAYYEKAGPLLHMLAELDMMVSLQFEHDQLLELRPMLERSGVRLLIDHCGRPATGKGVGQPGFRALLEMARSGRVAVKLSGFQKFSSQRPPFADTQPYLEALLEAFTLDACLWASDWPYLRAPERLDVGPCVRLFERLLPNAADRQRLFFDTPRRWLGF